VNRKILNRSLDPMLPPQDLRGLCRGSPLPFRDPRPVSPPWGESHFRLLNPLSAEREISRFYFSIVSFSTSSRHGLVASFNTSNGNKSKLDANAILPFPPSVVLGNRISPLISSWKERHTSRNLAQQENSKLTNDFERGCSALDVVHAKRIHAGQS
jgi:hypothetical protein